MMNTKIALSGISIIAALTMLSAAVFAQFTASATLAGNTFSTGAPGLLISTDNEQFASTVPGFSETELYPGYSETFRFWLRNSSDGNVDFDLKSHLTGVTGSTALRENLEITMRCSGQEALGPITIADWQAQGSKAFGEIAQGQTIACGMIVELPEDSSGDIANSNVQFNVVFDGIQQIEGE